EIVVAEQIATRKSQRRRGGLRCLDERVLRVSEPPLVEQVQDQSVIPPDAERVERNEAILSQPEAQDVGFAGHRLECLDQAIVVTADGAEPRRPITRMFVVTEEE